MTADDKEQAKAMPCRGLFNRNNMKWVREVRASTTVISLPRLSSLSPPLAPSQPAGQCSLVFALGSAPLVSLHAAVVIGPVIATLTVVSGAHPATAAAPD
ncbi:hypothetical protein [Streptomyces tauricus]|uniref:hypothetical protein n=1 Tax=Streptomyces tauricus TaxID=68274 RepID=UPI002243505B|nr:hypothetical protein [Streptomyces tauricus]MCW8102852.1 hypothetical protein [Streptomyces tauricus]